MNKKFGFIGLGKMAKAIIGGIFNSDKNAQIIGFDPTNNIQGVEKVASNVDVVKQADVIFLCTKPFIIKDVLEEIKEHTTSEKLIISVAAGISIDFISKFFTNEQKIIRIMPNTPALIGEGAFALVAGNYVKSEDIDIIKNILSDIGIVIEENEDKIDIITALSGSGPAFYYYLIEAMAKSAQKLGLDYETALKLSSQTALGAAKMIQTSGMSTNELITAVTTKGGCTEVGNNILNNSQIQQIFDEVIEKTTKKAEELGKN